MIGVAATLSVHLLIGAAILHHWGFNPPQLAAPLVFVHIAEEKAGEPIDTPPEVKLKMPKLDLSPVELPEITEPQSNATGVASGRAAVPPRAPANSETIETYQAKLLRHLNYQKRYPLDAQRRHEQGVVILSFTIDSAGRVVAYRILRSSGCAALDEEVLALIQRASPLPAPPPELMRDPMEFVVPLQFFLR